MKYKKLIGVVFLTFIISLLSCSDNVELEKRDLKKYSWLTPFIQDYIKDFEGEHNIDLGILKFSYEEPTKSNLLLRFDSIAKKEHWKVTSKSHLERTFYRVVSDDNSGKGTVLKIQLDKVKNRVHFLIY